MIDTGHPWSDFLLARKVAIDWLLQEEKRSYEYVAKTLSMDEMQVQLISLTDKEEIG